MHSNNPLATLYINLNNALKEKKDIFPTLRDASKEDFLSIFAIKRKYQSQEQGQVEATLFGKHMTVSLFGDILKAAKHHMVLKEVLSKEIGSIMEGKHEDDKEIHTSETFFKVMDFVVAPKKKNMPEILETIQKSCELKSFLEASSEEDRNMIKDALKREIGELKDDQGKSKCQGWLKEIEKIESEIKAESEPLETSIQTNIEAKSKPIKTTRMPSKEMVFGCSIAVGVVVGLVFFAATFSLSGAVIVGIMAGMAAFPTIVCGAFVIALRNRESSPSKDLNEVNLRNEASVGAVQQCS